MLLFTAIWSGGQGHPLTAVAVDWSSLLEAISEWCWHLKYTDHWPGNSTLGTSSAGSLQRLLRGPGRRSPQHHVKEPRLQIPGVWGAEMCCVCSVESSRKEEAYVEQLSREHCSNVMSYVDSQHIYYVWIMQSYFWKDTCKASNHVCLEIVYEWLFHQVRWEIQEQVFGWKSWIWLFLFIYV